MRFLVLVWRLWRQKTKQAKNRINLRGLSRTIAKKINEQMLEMTSSDMMMPFQLRGSDTLTANSCLQMFGLHEVARRCMRLYELNWLLWRNKQDEESWSELECGERERERERTMN